MARTDSGRFIVMVATTAVPSRSPLQPRKVQPARGWAVACTSVLIGYLPPGGGRAIVPPSAAVARFKTDRVSLPVTAKLLLPPSCRAFPPPGQPPVAPLGMVKRPG